MISFVFPLLKVLASGRGGGDGLSSSSSKKLIGAAHLIKDIPLRFLDEESGTFEKLPVLDLGEQFKAVNVGSYILIPIVIKIQRFRIQVFEARAIVDLRAGRVRGVIAWMLVDLALSTGLRVNEMAALKIKDVDLKRGCLSVIRLKRKKRVRETLALGKDIAQHLKEYIIWTERKKGPLFLGSRGPLTAQGLQRVWKRSVHLAGLPKELSIHSARHTIAVQLLKKTGNLRLVQKQLGHASPATTANMYADISFEDMQNGVTGLYQ